jgi:RHS repeat-associated protein
MSDIRRVAALMLTLATTPTVATSQAAEVTFVSPTPADNSHIAGTTSTTTITVAFKGCSNTSGGSMTGTVNVNGSPGPTPTSTSTTCVDYTGLKRLFTATSVTLTPGANVVTVQTCHNTGGCGSAISRTIYYDVPQISVTPDGGSASGILHGASGSYGFTVTNNGPVTGTADLTPSCSGNIVSCSALPTSVSLNPGASATVTVSYTGNGEGTGTATLGASYAEYPSATDNGSVSVSVSPIISAEIITTFSKPMNLDPGQSSITLFRYRIRNTSQGTSSPSTYNVSIARTGIVTSCTTPSTTQVTVNPNDDSDFINISSCTVGTTTEPSSGTVTFSASTSGWSGDDATTVNAIPDYQISLSQPSSQTASARATAGSVTYTVYNNSVNVGSSTVVSLSRQCLDVVSCDPLGPSNNTVTVPVGGSENVTVNYGISLTGTTGTVSLTASKGSSTSTKVTSIGTTPDYKVIVARTAADTTLSPGATGASAKFTITNNSTNTGQNTTYTFTPTCTGPFVTGCNGTPDPVTLGDQQATSAGAVALNYYTGPVGASGSVKLKASATTPGAQADSATTTIYATQSYAVSVLPESTTYRVTAGDTVATLRFKVRNTSVNAAAASNYDLTATPTGDISTAPCAGPGSVTLSQGDSSVLAYSCPIGAVGSTGNVKLKALASLPQPHQQEQGTDLTILPWYKVTATPAKAIDTVPAMRTRDTLDFTVRNASRNTTGPIAFSFTKNCGPVISCPYANTNMTVVQGADSIVKVIYDVSLLGTEGNLTLTASASSPAGLNGNGSATIRTTPRYEVSVTRSISDTTLPARTTSVVPTFTVQNLSSNTPTGSATFTLLAACGVLTSCEQTQGTLTLADRASAPHTVSPTSINWSGQSGFVKLTATSGGISAKDSTKYNATPFPEVTIQVSEPNKPLGKRPPPDSTRFRIHNSSSNTDGAAVAFTLTATCPTVTVSCTFPQQTVSLAEGVLSDYKWVPFTVGAVGISGTVQFNATAQSFSGSGISTVTPTPDYTFEIVPTPSSKTLDTLTTANSASYSIRNTGANTAGPITFTLARTCVGVVACSTNPTTVSVAQGGDSIRSISFSVDSVGTNGSVTVIASASSPEALLDTAVTSIFTTPRYKVVVTPNLTPQTIGERAESGTSSFKIRNLSWNTAGPISFTPSATCTVIARPASCSVSGTPIELQQWAQSADINVTYSVDSIGTAGTATLTVSATAPTAFQGSGTTNLLATPSYRIAVTPAFTPKTVGAGTPQTFNATIKNTSWNTDTPITATLSTPTCSNQVLGSCSMPSNSVPLTQGAATAPITLTYDALAVGNETVALNASGSVTGGTVGVTNGSLAVTVSDSGSISISTAGLNPGTTIDRSQCLTIAAGQNAAYECGDLRIVQPLPATITMNKPHAPALIYNSRHAKPGALLAANVTYSGVAPLTLYATVSLNGVAMPSRQFTFNSVCQGTTCRIVVPVDATPTMATGVYTAQLQVSARSGSFTYATSAMVTDTVVIVNRAASWFGVGWWVDGLETLVNVSATQKLWVGGDGSTRLYTQSASNSSVYTVVPAYDRPDTLLWTGSTWQRRLGNGAYVEINNLGQHIKTVNAAGWQTTFLHHGIPGTALMDITLPKPEVSSPSRVYTFNYSLAGSQPSLSSISVPAASFARTVTLTRDNYRVTGVAGADGNATTFVYDAAGRMIERRNKLGDPTIFTYDDAGALKQTKLSMARTNGAGDTITTTFKAAETRSAAIASDTVTQLATMYTRLDGPRTDVSDTTNFYVNRWGAPDTIVNALGDTTRLWRTNAQFPALVTKARNPVGFEQRAVFTARALVDSLIAVNPLGDGINSVTTFQWHTKWDRFVKRFGPSGEIDSVFYSDTNAVPLWHQTGPDTSRRWNFAYNSSRLLEYVQPPGHTTSQRQRLEYDPLGNLRKVTSPIGFITLLYKNQIGQDSVILTPTDSTDARTETGLQNTGLRDSIVYDLMDRPLLTRSLSRASAVASQRQLLTQNAYDQEGNVLSVSRWSVPDSANVATLTTSWTYDAARRQRTETSPDGKVVTRTFDKAGNVTQIQTRRNHAITTEYDALNRPFRRTVPQVVYPSRSGQGIATISLGNVGQKNYPWFPNDSINNGLIIAASVDTFVYGPQGLTYARNPDAIVRRTYYPNGLLKDDTLVIATLETRDTTTHVYGLLLQYDRSGRRTYLGHPIEFWFTGSNIFAQFAYDTVGQLKSVTDLMGNVFSYSYNGRGDPVRLSLPAGLRDSSEFDLDGRLVRSLMMNTTTAVAAKYPDDTLRHQRLKLDATGRALVQTNSFGMQTTDSTFYNGLGHLVRRSVQQPAVSNYGWAASIRNKETFSLDGLGNRFASTSLDSASDGGGWVQMKFGGFSSTYQAGRLSGVNQTSLNERFVYDSAGNTVYKYFQPAPLGSVVDDRALFYGADDRLRVAEQRELKMDGSAAQSNWYWRMNYEEYRYDPLGRRVLVYARRDCLTESGLDAACKRGFVQRTIWDGNAELYEIRMPIALAENDVQPVNAGSVSFPTFNSMSPQYGRVAYAYGLSLDRPLSITRTNYADSLASQPYQDYPSFTVVPHWDWRGHADMGTMANGSTKFCAVTGRCTEVKWRHQNYAFVKNTLGDTVVPWFGSMIDDKTDASGLLFRRNRYLDPLNGRFTQEDPIGLAGGMNLYGFAAGDPMNGADPFGLYVEFKDDNDGVMRHHWELAKRQLGRAAGRDRAARDLLRVMEGMEKDTSTTYTFQNAAIEGDALGRSWPGSTTMLIDVNKITLGSRGQASVGSVMIHESGHVNYGRTRGLFGHDTETSYMYAQDFENRYRRIVAFCLSSGHGVLPPWGCRP